VRENENASKELDLIAFQSLLDEYPIIIDEEFYKAA
tara:strand:+ start:7425 stop:7532 length:108 start_codon:yes stop_codon:yes gene_type:complete